MRYQTIVMELFESRPQFHDRLKKSNILLTTIETEAAELKRSHREWIDALTNEESNLEPSQIRSVAMELALDELEERLLNALEFEEPPELTRYKGLLVRD